MNALNGVSARLSAIGKALRDAASLLAARRHALAKAQARADLMETAYLQQLRVNGQLVDAHGRQKAVGE